MISGISILLIVQLLTILKLREENEMIILIKQTEILEDYANATQYRQEQPHKEEKRAYHEVVRQEFEGADYVPINLEV